MVHPVLIDTASKMFEYLGIEVQDLSSAVYGLTKSKGC